MRLYLLNKEYGRAEKACKILMDEIGDDAQLMVINANIHVFQEQYEQALPLALRAIELEPEYEAPWWLRLSCQLRLEAFGDASATIKSMCQQFGCTLDDFQFSEPGFAKFIESDEYQELIKQ